MALVILLLRRLRRWDVVVCAYSVRKVSLSNCLDKACAVNDKAMQHIHSILGTDICSRTRRCTGRAHTRRPRSIGLSAMHSRRRYSLHTRRTSLQSGIRWFGRRRPSASCAGTYLQCNAAVTESLFKQAVFKSRRMQHGVCTCPCATQSHASPSSPHHNDRRYAAVAEVLVLLEYQSSPSSHDPVSGSRIHAADRIVHT